MCLDFAVEFSLNILAIHEVMDSQSSHESLHLERQT